MSRCGAKTVVGGVEFTCDMSGHRLSDTAGPTHLARGRSDSGEIVVVRWAVARPMAATWPTFLSPTCGATHRPRFGGKLFVCTEPAGHDEEAGHVDARQHCFSWRAGDGKRGKSTGPR